MRILIVEDNPKSARLLEKGLRENAYAVDVARNGVDAVWMAQEIDFDVVVLDLTLPDIDGLEVLQQIRSSGSKVSVLLLTARDSVGDRVVGLDAGADDYLLKPYAFEELLARLRALARRGPVERAARMVVGDLVVDPSTRSVQRGAVEVHLTRKEFALLELLAMSPGEAVARQRLFEHAWDSHFDGDSNVLDVYIRYLRQKIDVPFGCTSIETVRGYGYRLKPVESNAPLD
jgi:two-component system, OmpR family, response regulator